MGLKLCWPKFDSIMLLLICLCIDILWLHSASSHAVFSSAGKRMTETKKIEQINGPKIYRCKRIIINMTFACGRTDSANKTNDKCRIKCILIFGSEMAGPQFDIHFGTQPNTGWDQQFYCVYHEFRDEQWSDNLEWALQSPIALNDFESIWLWENAVADIRPRFFRFCSPWQITS